MGIHKLVNVKKNGVSTLTNFANKRNALYELDKHYHSYVLSCKKASLRDRDVYRDRYADNMPFLGWRKCFGGGGGGNGMNNVHKQKTRVRLPTYEDV